MSLLVGTVINNARDLHPALSKVNAPPILGVRALSRMVAGFYQDIVPRSPAFFATELSISLPIASFTAGVDLGALIPGGWQEILDGYCVFTGSTVDQPSRVKAQFIPYELRGGSYPLPAFTLRGKTLFFLGVEGDYTPFSSFLLTYTPLATALTSESSTIPMGEDALGVLTSMLAAFYLRRLVDDPQYRVTDRTASLYENDAKVERKGYLSSIFRQGQRQEYAVRDET